MNPRSTLRALRFRRKKKWSEFSTRNCGTTQISDSYALAPSITLNPGLEPDRLQQENASSDGEPDISALGPGCVKSLSFNLRVERLSQFRRYRKQLHSERLSRVDN